MPPQLLHAINSRLACSAFDDTELMGRIANSILLLCATAAFARNEVCRGNCTSHPMLLQVRRKASVSLAKSCETTRVGELCYEEMYLAYHNGMEINPEYFQGLRLGSPH